MKLRWNLAAAALLALFPLSSLALFHRSQHPIPLRPPAHPVHRAENRYRPPSHPHTPFEKHESAHGKAFKNEVKEHFKDAKAGRPS